MKLAELVSQEILTIADSFAGRPIEDEKAALLTLAFLSEHQQRFLQAEIIDRIPKHSKVVVGVITDDESKSFLLDGVSIRIDEAHEYRDKSVIDLEVLLLLVPTGLETKVKNTGLENPALSLDLDRYWKKIIESVRDDLPQSKQTFYDDVVGAEVVRKRRLPLVKILGFADAIRQEEELSLIGRHLWLVGLVPDVGAGSIGRLQLNDQCSSRLESRTQPHQDIEARLRDCALRAGPVRLELSRLLNRRDVVLSERGSWQQHISSELVEVLSFHLWEIASIASELEQIHVPSFFKSDGTVVSTCRLEQPGGAHSPLFASTAKGVKLSWNTDPGVVRGISQWRIRLVPKSDIDLDNIPDLPEVSVSASRRSVLFSLDEFESNEELELLCSQFQFNIHVTGLDSLGAEISRDSEIIRGVTDSFIIEIRDDRPIVHNTNQTFLDMSLARLWAVQNLAAGELICRTLPREENVGLFRFETGETKKADIRIPVNQMLSDLMMKIVRADEPSCLSAKVKGRENLENLIEHEGVTRTHVELPKTVFQRRLEFIKAVQNLNTSSGCLEDLRIEDWLGGLQKKARSYYRSYFDDLSNQSPDEMAQYLSVDTITLRLLEEGQWHSVLVMLPSHPIRLAWYDHYVSTLSDIEDRLGGLAVSRRKYSLDIGLLLEVLPENFPLIMVDEHGEKFVFFESIGLSGSIYFSESTSDVNLVRNLIARNFNIDSQKDSIILDPKLLGNRLTLYVQTHPYVDRLRVLANAVGSGKFMAAAVEEYISESNLSQSIDESASKRRLSITALDNTSKTPNPLPHLIQLQTSIEAENLLGTGTFLKPTFDLTVSDKNVSDVSDDFHVYVTVESTIPRVGETPKITGRSSLFSGLINPTEMMFEADDEGVKWTTTAAVSHGNSSNKGAVELSSFVSKIQMAIGQSLLMGNGFPSLQVSRDHQELLAIDYQHRISDWVISINRYSGGEVLDSPLDSFVGRKSRNYLLDYSPDFHDGFGHRLMVSTRLRAEIEGLINNGLRELGFGDTDVTSTLLLDDLRALSGSLALKVVEGGTFAREAVGLAIVSRYLKRQGLLKDTIVIPVDAHQPLFRRLDGSEINSNERCDLLLVRLKNKTIEIELVEVKQRSGNVDRALLTKIARQTEQTERIIDERYFSQQLRLDHSLHRSRLIGVLSGYLNRAVRYGEISESDRDVFRERIDRLDWGFEVCTFSRSGYIVNLDQPGQDPLEHNGTRITFLSEEDLRPAGLISRKTELFETAKSTMGTSKTDIKDSDKDIPPNPQDSPNDESNVKPLDSEAIGIDEADAAIQFVSDEQPEKEIPVEQVVINIASDADLEIAPELVVELGVVRGTEKSVEWRISTKGSPHMFIAGMPGQGKSSTLMRIIDSLKKQGLPSLIFDYHGQFAGDMPNHFPILNIADGLPFSPFEASGRRGDSYKINAFQVAEIFESLAKLGPIQRDHVYKTLLRIYQEGGFDETSIGKSPSVSKFMASLEEEEKSKSGGQNALSRLRPLLDFGLFSETSSREFGEFLKSGAIIDLSENPIPIIQDAAGAFILRKIYREMSAMGETDRLRILIVLDEAGRLKADATLPKIMKEGRKFGIAVVVASQRTNDMNPDVLQNCGGKVIFRLNVGESKRGAGFIRGRANDDLTTEIENLGVGEGYVQTNEMPRALRTQLFKFPED